MRLIAFGCSSAYGQGLDDCFIPPDGISDIPSKFAWPAIIAKELNIKCINKSTPGASNKRIWHDIINFNFKDGDIVFILWTYPIRSATLEKSSSKIKNIGMWTEHNESYYTHFYSDYDGIAMSKLFVSNANTHLESLNVQTYNLVLHSRFNKIFTLSGNTIPHVPVYFKEESFSFKTAKDGVHPNQECHTEMARKVMSTIGLKHTIPNQLRESFIFKLKNIIKEHVN